MLSLPVWIESLTLNNFRNYEYLKLNLAPTPIILIGPNGAGKTNILEAISFLNPGKGLRRTPLREIKNFHHPEKGWYVNALVKISEDPVSLATGVDPDHEEKRLIKINGTFTPQNELGAWISIIWQTPKMDGLFLDAPSTRRKFLDRLISAVNEYYPTHLYRYEHSLRERSRILKENFQDKAWLSVLEEKMAQESVAITTLRQDFIHQLNTFSEKRNTAFPQPYIILQGSIETWLETMPALEVEDKIQQGLMENRAQDALRGGANIGAHHSDIEVIMRDTGQRAALCSTGQQKALLLSLLMANCRLQTAVRGTPPIVLLDEVVAHLDQQRRYELMEEIFQLKAHAWLTGTEDRVFWDLKNRAQFLSIQNNTITSKD